MSVRMPSMYSQERTPCSWHVSVHCLTMYILLDLTTLVQICAVMRWVDGQMSSRM